MKFHLRNTLKCFSCNFQLLYTTKDIINVIESPCGNSLTVSVCVCGKVHWNENFLICYKFHFSWKRIGKKRKIQRTVKFFDFRLVFTIPKKFWFSFPLPHPPDNLYFSGFNKFEFGFSKDSCNSESIRRTCNWFVKASRS